MLLGTDWKRVGGQTGQTNNTLWPSHFGDIMERGMARTAYQFGCCLQEGMEPVILDSLNGSVPCVRLRINCKCFLSSAGIIK